MHICVFVWPADWIIYIYIIYIYISTISPFLLSEKSDASSLPIFQSAMTGGLGSLAWPPARGSARWKTPGNIARPVPQSRHPQRAPA